MTGNAQCIRAERTSAQTQRTPDSKHPVPGLLLQDEMGLHKELDAESQATRRHVVHLLADAVPQVQPQVLPLAAGELQSEVVHFYDTHHKNNQMDGFIE